MSGDAVSGQRCAFRSQCMSAGSQFTEAGSVWKQGSAVPQAPRTVLLGYRNKPAQNTKPSPAGYVPVGLTMSVDFPRKRYVWPCHAMAWLLIPSPPFLPFPVNPNPQSGTIPHHSVLLLQCLLHPAPSEAPNPCTHPGLAMPYRHRTVH